MKDNKTIEICTYYEKPRGGKNVNVSFPLTLFVFYRWSRDSSLMEFKLEKMYIKYLLNRKYEGFLCHVVK